MTTVVGIGKEKMEYYGSLLAAEADEISALTSCELPAEMVAGTELRLMLVTEGRIEIHTARIAGRAGRRVTFMPFDERIMVRRRMEARVPARITVEYKAQDGKFRQTWTQDISSNGLALTELSDAPLPDRTQLRLTLPAGAAAHCAVAMGAVVNRRIFGGGEQVVGVQLLEMAENDRAAFHQFLESQAERQDALAA